MGLGIVVEADVAGYGYVEALTEGFGVDEHLSEVIDAVVRAVENTGSQNDAITVNRTSSIRTSVAHDSFSVERIVRSNGAQVQAFGPRVNGIKLARRPAKEWLGYAPRSHSAPKVAAIEVREIELVLDVGGSANSCQLQQHLQ